MAKGQKISKLQHLKFLLYYFSSFECSWKVFCLLVLSRYTVVDSDFGDCFLFHCDVIVCVKEQLEKGTQQFSPGEDSEA